MTSKTILSDDDKHEIAKRYAAGEGIVVLARAFRCRTSQIGEILKDREISRQSLTANTPIEQRLHGALMAAGIGFATQRRLVGRYVVDILIHQAPVIIEADGMRHRSGAAAQERDAKRDAAHEAAGYRVFRFTGSEINTDAAACVQRMADACGLVPDKHPVYDIRTKFSGADHPRYVGLYELTCGYCGEKFQSKRAKRKYCSHEHYILGAQKGKPKSESVRAALAESNRTRDWTPESRAKLSASRTGQPGLKGREISPEQRAKISATLKGRTESEETRAKKRAGHLGKKRSPETAAKIGAALKGKPKSDAHKANISASRKRQDQTKIESDPA